MLSRNLKKRRKLVKNVKLVHKKDPIIHIENVVGAQNPKKMLLLLRLLLINGLSLVSEEGNDKNKRQVLEQNTTDPSVAGPSASFVNHKKFHYQTRISVNVNDEVAQACNSHSATIGK